MSQQVDTGCKGFMNGTTARNRYLRVKLASGVLETAGLERAIGVASERQEASVHCGVDLFSKQGTILMVASGVISESATVYGAAAGKISASQGTGAFVEGVALEAAAADEDIIEVMPFLGETVGT